MPNYKISIYLNKRVVYLRKFSMYHNKIKLCDDFEEATIFKHNRAHRYCSRLNKNNIPAKLIEVKE